ncbi:glycosyltransferase family 2 protein, partial [Phascolarctobacterium succinatutens]
MNNNLTVVVLTKNEEENIVAVVQNAKKVAAEVLIVDSGSTDKTVQLAEENGAKVVYRAWDNDFAAQRNFALQHVKTEWVLYLDADERMTDDLCCAVEKAMATKAQKQYSIMRKIHAFGFTYKHGI